MWVEALRYLLTRRGQGAKGGAHDRRLLVLARDCPPSNWGGVYRLIALLRATTNAEWTTEVVAGPPPTEIEPAGRELFADIPPEVRIHRWSAAQWTPSARFSPFVDGEFRSIGRVLGLTRELRAPYRAVIATGPHFAEFVAGAVLARRWGVPLVLDYRDEWCESLPPFVERGRTDRFWERFCLSRAREIVFTTDASRRHYLKVFPFLDAERTHVVRNGWDNLPEHTSPASAPDRKSDPRLRLGFYGWLGEHWDFPEFAATLIAATQAVPTLSARWSFRFVGRKTEENESLLASTALRSFVTSVPQIPFTQARQEMRRSSVLLLLNSPVQSRMLPAKLFEYVGARRPVLLYGTGGEMEACLRGIPGSRFVARGDPQALHRALRDIENGSAQYEIDQAPPNIVQGLSRDAQIKRFLQILEGLTDA